MPWTPCAARRSASEARTFPPLGGGKVTVFSGRPSRGGPFSNPDGRETYEEIGVKIPLDKFKLLSVKKEEVYIPDYQVTNRHFIYSYFAVVDYKIEDYTKQEEEVSDLKYITIEEMEKAYKNKDANFTFIKWKNVDNVIEMLKEIRKEKCPQ